ncbi:hypothetical protein QJS10_CPA02g00086 [Acorus calamus]|uniref:16S rRNA (uracil(1498)-N(3))-methyltransferase n=1 Tax=Acorus calamus TaxID=4465 RepID=A0AAV9FFI8_ACOCL|nr:hypothetical protein QJS10_CPA02g00086 [Acorus calamus]
MRTLAVRDSLPLLLRRRWRNLRRRLITRAFSTSSPTVMVDRSRGGLPRFHSPVLPPSKGSVVRVQGEEFWHATKVLRLSESDRVELFNGTGGIVTGFIHKVDRTGLDFMASEDVKNVAPQGTQWHVFAAFGTLKGGRADWLIEKCTELGASSVTPLLTERSPSITENRVDRLHRVILAAVKQCQRLHEMTLNPPMKLCSFLPLVSQSELSFLAAAGATPLIDILSCSRREASGVMIVGPEGDFTEEEVKLMIKSGATPVGLGPHRLRAETATITLLSALMLWSNTQKPELH